MWVKKSLRHHLLMHNIAVYSFFLILYNYCPRIKKHFGGNGIIIDRKTSHMQQRLMFSQKNNINSLYIRMLSYNHSRLSYIPLISSSQVFTLQHLFSSLLSSSTVFGISHFSVYNSTQTTNA